MYDVLVLAGGGGKRFGGDKALATFRGEPMIKRMLTNFRGKNIIISVGTYEQLTSIRDVIGEVSDVRFVVDKLNGVGPVEGLRVGLHECSSDVVFVVGCDHPFCSNDFADRLMNFMNRVDAVIPYWVKHQPTCAMYRRETVLRGVEQVVKRAEKKEDEKPERMRGSILDALEGLEIMFVDARLIDVYATLSFNTPIELAILEELNISRK